MELAIAGVSHEIDNYSVKGAFATVLHSVFFRRFMDDGPINFHVELGAHETLRHDGTGRLTVPSRAIGNKLLQVLACMPPGARHRIFGSIRLSDTDRRPHPGIIQTLRKVSYVEPDVDKERDAIFNQMNTTWSINDLQFGQWLKKPTVGKETAIAQGGVFVQEWSKNYTKVGNASLNIDYKHRLIRMTLGRPLLDEQMFSVVIKFSNIQYIWFGHEHSPCMYASRAHCTR